jgi:hypothetical protein
MTSLKIFILNYFVTKSRKDARNEKGVTEVAVEAKDNN